MLQVGAIIKGPYWSEVVEIKSCEPIDETMFLVEAIGRQSNQFYAQYLEKQELESLEHLHQARESVFEPDQLQHYLHYHVLKADQLYSKSRARGNKKIMPLPHQIEAVYSRMLQTPSVRFLLADDPGAGKTIMSGMLIRELAARQSAKRMLVLAPPLVLRQWQDELQEKFDEEFAIITRASLKESGDSNPFERYDKCIASVYWAAREDVKSLLIQAEFDLVIIDEAHKMAAYTHGVKKKKIQRTKLYQLGEAVLRRTEHCLLLTATPHKGDKENFRHLMSLIDHDIFSKLNTNESMYEKSNPFVIRRLKESMKRFDGTPLFPKRRTETLPFNLSFEEQDLYEEVTAYVREHFNRAKRNNNNSTAFAMMLLQRRLSSSLEAIHLSLVRRKEKLEKMMRDQMLRHQIVPIEEYEEVTSDEQEEIEQLVEGETNALDLDELQLEIDELTRLIRKSTGLRLGENERKYQELEDTLLGDRGLLAKGEKILIFTESKDTLHYLESRLLTHVPSLAKIVGSDSMEQRRAEVEKFRNDVQIMLATDAGGESINLQFCNQMINYDIPWNPNRLEQRMGRIHRIGQKNEVVIVNLVAVNTKEGEVMRRLLEKMETMRDDLGQELVYDFIGEVLEEESVDLASLMEAAISGRENLDDLIANMEKRLSEEHQRLLELTKAERLDEQSFDLPGMRTTYRELSANTLPLRVYGEFVLQQFHETRIRLNISGDGAVVRIDRIPKNIREWSRKHHIFLESESSYRFTVMAEKEKNDVSMLPNDHSLFKLSLLLAAKEVQEMSTPSCRIQYPVSEPLLVEVNEVSLVDGTGRELEQKLLLVGKRENGEVVTIDPYWLFMSEMGECQPYVMEDPTIIREVIAQARRELFKFRAKREENLNKRGQFLRRSFESQLNTLYDRLQVYQSENHDNRNSALINQTMAQIDDVEERRNERLDEIERERSIQLRPVKKIAQLYVTPTLDAFGRVIPKDYEEIVQAYEFGQGRLNVRGQDAYGLVDFISEQTDGESRFIIVTQDLEAMIKRLNLADYRSISHQVYLYVCQGQQVVEEHPLVEFLTNTYQESLA